MNRSKNLFFAASAHAAAVKNRFAVQHGFSYDQRIDVLVLASNCDITAKGGNLNSHSLLLCYLANKTIFDSGTDILAQCGALRGASESSGTRPDKGQESLTMI